MPGGSATWPRRPWRGFAQAVAEALPETAHGVRVAGDPDRPVRRVAVCGGAGDFLLGRVLGSGADVYVTSDLRHHPAAEFLEQGGPALVDVAHWAAEWTWLPVVRARVDEALGDTVETRVSTLRTDPWQFRTLKEPTLKADPSVQLKLLDVQELDARAAQLRHQRASLPELAEIAELEQSRAALDNQVRDAQIQVDDLTVEQTKVDADVEQVKTRRTRDRDRMDQGLITNPKDLERMQHELTSLERRITSLEDDELEVMARLEDAQKDLDSLTAQLQAADARLVELAKARDEKAAAIDGELAEIDRERAPAVEGLPADLLALYDRLRDAEGRRRRGRAARPRVQRLPAHHRQRRAGRDPAPRPDDEVIRCEECQRILVRTPESGL